MEPIPQPSEIAAAALAKASDFVASLRPFAAAGFWAVEEAIGLLCDPSNVEESLQLRSTALSGLGAILTECDAADE